MKYLLTILALCLCIAGCGKKKASQSAKEQPSKLKVEEKAPSTPAVPEMIDPKLSGVVDQSWNLAYNISLKYPDSETRWKYVYAAVKLLRDEGIKRYPKEPLVYNQLAYLFEHKIGHNLDDHHRYYKFRWMQAMEGVLWESPQAGHLAKGAPDFESLINPDNNNKELMERVRRLRQE